MTTTGAGAHNSALYRGEIVHARNDAHARRTFRYGVFMAAIDLDELATLDRDLRLFSYERSNLFAFRDRDYSATLSPSTVADTMTTTHAQAGRPLRDELDALRAANDLPQPYATRAITNLRTFGYLFNPVSFFIDYARSGDITSVIAEVNNTYGGRFRYVLGPLTRVPGPRARFRHTRELFVSPFLHGPVSYDFCFDAPLDGAAIAITMHVVTATGQRVFTARFSGERVALSDRTLAAAAVRYPLMTAQVIGLIHWQALKLRFARVPYLRPDREHRPAPDV